MSKCNLTKEENIWPEMGDDSGDSMFLLDNNSLIKQIREMRKVKERDLFLENLDSPEVVEEENIVMQPAPGMVKVRYEDLTKKDKVAYILNQLEKYKKNDN